MQPHQDNKRTSFIVIGFADRHLILMDEAKDCCANIATVAELLEAYGKRPGSKITGDNTVAHSGNMIQREADRLRKLIDDIRHFTKELQKQRENVYRERSLG